MLIYFKSNLHYARRITSKRVTSGGAHLRRVAPGYTAPNNRCNGGEPLATLCRFDRSGNRAPDFPHRERALSNRAKSRCAHMLMISKMLFRTIKYYNFTCSQFTSILTMGCAVQRSKRKETSKKIETRKKENNSWY